MNFDVVCDMKGTQNPVSLLRRYTDRRFAILALLTLLIVGVKIFEGVIAKESGPADTALLRLIRDNTPAVVVDFFYLGDVEWFRQVFSASFHCVSCFVFCHAP